MKRNFLRVAGIILVLSVFAWSFIGCGTKEQPVTTATTAAASTTAAATEPAVVTPDTSPLTLTAFYYQPRPYPNEWGTDRVSKTITEKTGITLDVKFSATGDGQDLSVMLASGEKLPDFIVNDAGTAVANTLRTQGFVQDLNKLAKEYSPDFFKYIPENYQSIWGEKDGALYQVVDFYGDKTTLTGFKSTGAFSQSIMVQKAALEKAGNPSMTTLDEFKAALLKVKETSPNIKFLLTPGELNPWGSKSWAAILTRIYGGDNPVSIQADGTVHYYYKDEAYKKAIAYLNDLYRAGLINPEVLTWETTNDPRDAARSSLSIFANMGQYQDFVQKIDKGMTADSPYMTIEYPKAAGVDTIKIRNEFVGKGGWHGTFITKDTEHADRAIQYLTFMISDEGQVLQRYGVEGVDYEKADDGSPKPTQTAIDELAKSYDEYTKTSGTNNWNWVWFESMRNVCFGYYWTLVTQPPLEADQQIQQKYSNDEMINDLVGVIDGDDIRTLDTKIKDLWKQSQTEMIMAKSAEAFETAYNSFIDKADKLGAPTLEKYFADNYKKWVDKGMK